MEKILFLLHDLFMVDMGTKIASEMNGWLLFW